MSRRAVLFSWIAFFYLSAGIFLHAADPVNFDGFHEAYISRDSGPPVFNSVAEKTPPPLNEQVPKINSDHAIWIPGYWAWSKQDKEYVWVAGVWRVPPPGMVWVPGEWTRFDGIGWAWLNGFWSQQPLDKLAYLEAAPPDPIVEMPGFPDSSNYFWNPGVWIYDEGSKKYEWVSGNWELLDSNWILVPAHYEWRRGGYLFIPAYWDWPLDRRGTAYAPVYIPAESQKEAFTPVNRLEELRTDNILISYYPNYLYICHHIYHFRPERWAAIAPTWWQWHSWWSLPWHNQWGLWWWFTHGGYPTPIGLTQDIAERIRPANPRLLQMVSKDTPPFVIGPNGMVSPEAVLGVLYEKRAPHMRVPVLPSDREALEDIQEEADKKMMRPARAQEDLKDVEPSKRGKLYGIREAVVHSAEVDTTIAPDAPRVSLPRKPILTPGQPQKATVNHDKPELQKAKARPAHPDIEPIPVKELKEAKGKIEHGKSGRAKHIPPPNPSVIQQVLPGPRVGPAIEFDDEKRKKAARHVKSVPSDGSQGSPAPDR